MATKKATTAASSRPAPSSTIETALGGPNTYAIQVLGDRLAPTILDGQFAIFDPDAGRALRGEVVALWLKGEQAPFVVRLATAVPPVDVQATDALLGIETSPGSWRPLPMTRVARVDRMLEASRAGEACDA